MLDFQTPMSRDWDHPVLARFVQAGLLHRDAKLNDVINFGRGQLCYLATPYSKAAVLECGKWDPGASAACSVCAAEWSRLLALDGITAVSPIIQAVEMVHVDYFEPHLDPLDAQFWEGWCRPLLAASGVVIVPPIPGWKDSDGIWGEVCQALRLNRPVFLISPGEEFGGAG